MHNDYTVKSGPQRVRDLMGAEAGELLKRPLRRDQCLAPDPRPVEETPLALCDARSVSPQDWVATDLLYPDRVGEIYDVAHNPAQRWFYFPRDDAGGGGAAEMLRLRDRRPRPLQPPHRLRRSDLAGKRPPARKHRSAHAGVLRRRTAGSGMTTAKQEALATDERR